MCKQNGHSIEQREYAMILRRDCVKIQSQKESVFKWWIRIPLHPESVWVPIELPHEQEQLLRYDIRECKLLRDGARRFVNITLQKEARQTQVCNNPPN